MPRWVNSQHTKNPGELAFDCLLLFLSRFTMLIFRLIYRPRCSCVDRQVSIIRGGAIGSLRPDIDGRASGLEGRVSEKGSEQS